MRRRDFFKAILAGAAASVIVKLPKAFCGEHFPTMKGRTFTGARAYITLHGKKVDILSFDPDAIITYEPVGMITRSFRVIDSDLNEIAGVKGPLW